MQGGEHTALQAQHSLAAAAGWWRCMLHTDTACAAHRWSAGLLSCDHCVLCSPAHQSSTQQVLMLLLSSYMLLDELLQLVRLCSNHLIDLLAVFENLFTFSMAVRDGSQYAGEGC